MATQTQTPILKALTDIPQTEESTLPVYDCSSLTGDYMVTIVGQTVAQWRERAPHNLICEYIDGIIYMPNAPTDEHQDVAGFLYDILNGWRYARGTGPVRFAPGALPLRHDRNPQPDVVVRPPEGRDDVPALLVVEVLSPSTRHHDLGKKAAIYQEAGIPELWFVDLEERCLEIHRRGDDGRYTTEQIAEGRRASSALPGFWIDVTWLWARPLPNPRACLETILAGPPV